MTDDGTTASRAEKQFAGLISTLEEAQRAVDVAGVHIACAAPESAQRELGNGQSAIKIALGIARSLSGNDAEEIPAHMRHEW